MAMSTQSREKVDMKKIMENSNMYKEEIDLRADDGKVISIKDGGGHIEIFVEDGDVEKLIKFSYSQWNDVTNSIDSQWGLKTFENISDK